jgi:hypothetical protein
MHTLLYSRTFARTPVNLIPKSRENTKCEQYYYKTTKGGDPLKYGCRTDTSSGDTNVSKDCMETEEILREQKTYKDGSGYHSDVEVDYGDEEIKSDKAYYPSVYFHTYQLDTSKPAFAPYMNNKGFDSLQLNIMVSDIELYYGCNYMLISPNNRIMLNLNKNILALFLNTKFNDLNKACYDNPKITDRLLILKKFRLKNTGNRYILEKTNLNVYSLDSTNVEDIDFTIEVVNPKITSQPPYALVLDNTGRMHVYDNNDKEVTSSKLTEAFAYDGQPNPYGSESSTTVPMSTINDFDDSSKCYFANEQYNSTKNYRCRLLNLVAYLQYRGLLKEMAVYNSDDEDIRQRFQIMYEKVDTFNSAEDYVRRIIDLVNYIEMHHHMHIDESVINSYFENKGISTEEDDSNESELHPSYDKVPMYNDEQSMKDRILNLKNYMKSYNILKDDPQYNDQALTEQSQQLPLTASLEQDIALYNKDSDYQQRLMNLQSLYPFSEYENEL